MIDELKTLALQHGYKLEFVPIKMLKAFQQELSQFINEPHLYYKQKRNVESQMPHLQAIEQAANKYESIIIVAVPREGHSRKDAQVLIRDAVKKAGYTIKNQSVLPYKRLAVQSGLAKYGRNNIAYVDGMGSWCKFIAFLTNITSDSSSWRDQPVMTDMCENCDLCINSCPTGAISKDRFLLYRENCKGGGGCSVCQDVCPINKAK